jgi:signal transduction histidine kinase
VDVVKQQNTRIAQVLLMAVASLTIVGLFAANAMNGQPAIFDLRFNAYALVSLAAVIMTLSFLYISTRTSIRGAEAIWFNLFVSCITVFAAAEFFMRLSATPEGAIFWDKFFGIGALESAAGFLFILNYLSPSVRHVRTTVFLILGSVVILFFFSNSNLIVNNNVHDIKLYAWGYYNDIGKWYILDVVWILANATAALFLILRYLYKNQNPVMARQARLFLIASVLPLIGSLITEDILPAFGITVLSFHVIFGALSAGIMLWGLNRYHVFRVSPAMISEEILSLMSESVVVVNKDLHIEFVNHEAEQLLGKGGMSLQQRPIIPFFITESEKILQDGLASLKNDNTIVLDNIVINNTTLSRTYARLSISRVTEENGIDGFIFVITDVTELKNSYDALEQEKANVEHTVQVRTKELREAQARLVETDKMKTEFVLLTSHNLRTPLTAIKGNIELLGLPVIKEEQKKELLEELKKASIKLGGLVEDLLTISTLEAGDSMVREQVQLDSIITPLLDEATALAAKNHNTFSSNLVIEHLTLQANARQIQTALRNLLDNAFKFTKNGRVTLSAAAHRDQLVITVADTGIGISASELPKLFTKFHRATDAMQYDYDGEGIGLYLTKLIVDEHGGKVGVVSSQGKGTTFTITLPVINNPPTKQ